ncbi:recombination-associated protein RdgC [Motiliproteus sp. MSK22-1]|uniref:recombination-associated protein RdgC n=1 Tax=Motiliproteus sp. MSK22-1 TaxID=1897630 RepID=UPI000976DF1D|nr:recombination-associated protein RdgC [Motiliproteus sp. MSK22-1]OMH38760.1 recombination-associated protein RdgC [Motiliproteus sp. MSK22-1]
MWFKNLVFYRFTQPFKLNAQELQEKLEASPFVPCSSQEATRFGWTSPMGKLSEELVHASGNYLLISAKKEEKILPASVVKDFLLDKVEQIEQEQDRKVRKKERDALKDEIIFELLPKAFSRFQTTSAYIDLKEGLLIVDASSAKRAEDLSSFLRKTLGSLPVTIPAMNSAPSAIMTQWLSEESSLAAGFELGDEAELKDPRENGAIIRCKQQELVGEEIDVHLKAGKQAVKLALHYADNLSCVAGDDLILRRLKFSDLVLEKAAEMGAEDAAAAFDADFTLMAMELSTFIPHLLEALGGENKDAYAPAIAV